MDYSHARTWAEVSLSALGHNFNAVRALLRPGTLFCCAVKADAYGHGARMAAAHFERLGADYFAVATLPEAIELRECGIKRPILILGLTPPQYARELIEYKLTQMIPDPDSARALSAAAAALGGTILAHAKIETGMGRFGFQRVDELAAAHTLPHIDFEGVFTHFATADEPVDSGREYTERQYDRFVRFYSAAEALSGRAFRLHHCCNSGGTLAYPDFHLDMARAGLVLYGYNPFERVIDDVRIYSLPNHQLPPREAITGVSLIPAMSLKTRVAQIKRCRAGERISYGGKFTFTRDSAVAVLPIGYADGLSRSLSGKFSFRAGEKFIPQIGRICMDICMADITDAPEIRAGDAVTLFGPRPALSARDLADYCGTIPYELLCAVSSRIPRVYIG